MKIIIYSILVLGIPYLEYTHIVHSFEEVYLKLSTNYLVEDIIVIESEVFLNINIQDENDLVKSIEVFSLQGVREMLVTDCHSDSCVVNLNTLMPNNYQIVVTTKKEKAYTAIVTVGILY